MRIDRARVESGVAALSRRLSKRQLFALMGATGCLVAALVGELLIWMTSPSSSGLIRMGPSQLALLMDCSGSMSDGNRLAEVKRAATSFVRRVPLDKTAVGVVAFAGSAREVLGPSRSGDDLVRALDGLQVMDWTAMAEGLSVASEQLTRSTETVVASRAILLFTDGIPRDSAVVTAEESARRALEVAEAIRQEGIRIIAVGTGDADIGFLARITGSRDLVFYAQSGGFDAAFRRAEDVLRGAELVGSGVGQPLWVLLVRNVGWTILIALGLATLLVLGQNAYLRRELLPASSRRMIFRGAAMSGCAAGLIAQVGLQVVAGLQGSRWIAEALRIPAWAALGALLGLGLARVVPNLSRPDAMRGGGTGGAVAAVMLMIVGAMLGEALGRWVGAAILGGFIGYCLAWMEERAREASLRIHWAPNEVSELSLGEDPVVLGSSNEAHVYLPAEKGFPAVTGLVRLKAGQVEFENKMDSKIYPLRNGSRLELAGLVLEIKTS